MSNTTRQALAALPPLPKTHERIDECGYPACRPAYTAEQMAAELAQLVRTALQDKLPVLVGSYAVGA